MISVNNLSFSYPDGTSALKGVNFDLEEGKCLALLGANGSGKTTLLYSLIGVIPHIISGEVSGSVNIAGFDVWKSKLDEVIQKVGLVQQDPESQIVSTTIEAECAFAPSNLGLDKEDIKRRISWALDVVALQGYGESATQSLSYGQKQRLTIAATLTAKPHVLLLDEPLSNVDAFSRNSIISVLNSLKNDQGMTLVISTHDISGILEMVDYVLLLEKNGEQLAFGLLEEITRDVELFRQAGTNPPPILDIGLRSGFSRPPIHIDELCALLTQRLNKTKSGLGKPEIKLEIATPLGKQWNESTYEPILELVDLCFSYPEGHQVLNNVNLRIHKGNFIGIIGPNGSGKTTLIKHLVGLLRPNKGKVVFQERDIENLPVGQLAKKIGTVLQNPDHQLVHAKTVFDEVAYALRMSNTNKNYIHSKVQEALRIVNLEKKQDVYPGKLSFGEKKKLLLACMIAMRPEVLILDEPFFGLDYLGKTNLTKILNSLNNKGQTIIAATHDIDAIAKCAGRLIAIYQGKIVYDDATLNVLVDPSLNRYGLEPPKVIQLAKCLESRGVEVNWV